MMWWRRASVDFNAPAAVFDSYCDQTPVHQNAVDLLPDWNSAFPPEANIKAGKVPLFADGRIHEAIAAAGSIEGARVLEIGPLEGMHTYILNSHKPAFIDCIEANKGNYLKCLITKEILNLNHANFYLGEAVKWLETTPTHYDFAIASGVLYHMRDPALFLVNLLAKCDRLYIWTHYFDQALVASGRPRSRKRFTGQVLEREVNGLKIRYVERLYQGGGKSAKFCGGLQERHYWMHRADIIALIEANGFGDIVYSSEDPHHEGGPSFSLSCRRSGS